MLRKYIYVGLFSIIVAALVLVIVLRRMDQITPVEVIRAMPDDAVLLAERVDYAFFSESFFPESRIWIDFVNTSGRVWIDSLAGRLIDRVAGQEPLEEFLMKEGFSFSLHLQGKDQLTPLGYLAYGNRFTDHEFEELIFSLLHEETLVNDRRYEAENLYDISANTSGGPKTFSFSCVDGLCLISPSSLLIESAVRTIHSEGGGRTDPGLQRVRSTAGKYVHGNLFVNYRLAGSLFYPFVEAGHWNELEVLARLADWGELDLDIKKDAVILNGMTFADPGGSLFLGALNGQSPVRTDLIELLPSGVTSYLHLGISDLPSFEAGLADFFSGSGKWERIEAERQKIEQTYGIDLLREITDLMEDELAWFRMEEGSPGDKVLIIETRSRSETADAALRWIQQYLEVEPFDMGSYRTTYRLDDETRFAIYTMPGEFAGVLEPLDLYFKHFAVYENSLILGPSTEIVSRVIYQNVLQKTLVSDPVFKEMSDYISNRSNLTLFLKPYPFLAAREPILNQTSRKALESLELFFRRVPGIVVQYQSEDDLLYQSISGRYTSQIRERALTVWESLLDTVAVNKPALVINHNTQEKEIFIQDAAHRVYLINSTGRILWEKKLGGPVMSDIWQVDYYKNGKLQILFNTPEELHLLDRNGNYVERYPVSLRSGATAPMALFDYENDENYRIFVAGEDRKIQVYDLEGNIVSGWRFGTTESEVTAPPRHFRVGERDYIVFADQNRPYFLDRRGRERVDPDKRVIFSRRNSFALDMNIREDRPRWVSTDTSGNVVAVYQDGEVATLLEMDLDPGHFFQMQDIDKDGMPDYLFASGDEISARGQDGRRIFSYRVRGRISAMPDIYKFSASDIKVGITDRSRNRIYLVNSDGSLYEGFPLEGSTRFSIGYFAGSDSRFNLIVGSANNFLYNYSIE